MKQIKKEILISAPATKVWEHLTNSTKMAGWFLPNDFEPTVGKKFTLNCQVQGRIDCEVKEVVAPKRLVYTFKPATFEFETVVTFTLEEIGPRTKLTLVHSGWERLTPGEAAQFDMYEQGWQSRFLQQLQSAVESDK